MILRKRRKANKKYTDLKDYFRSLKPEQRRLVTLARFKMLHLKATYGWKAQAFQSRQWCRRTGGCHPSFQRRYRARAALRC